MGCGVRHIATVIEEASRSAVQVDGRRDMESVTAGLSREMNLLPEQLRQLRPALSELPPPWPRFSSDRQSSEATMPRQPASPSPPSSESSSA